MGGYCVTFWGSLWHYALLCRSGGFLWFFFAKKRNKSEFLLQGTLRYQNNSKHDLWNIGEYSGKVVSILFSISLWVREKEREMWLGVGVELIWHFVWNEWYGRSTSVRNVTHHNNDVHKWKPQFTKSVDGIRWELEHMQCGRCNIPECLWLCGCQF